jgi:hypothetical protein
MINNITIKTWFSIRTITADMKSLLVNENYNNWFYHKCKVYKFDTKEEFIAFMDQVQKKHNLF